LRASRLHRSRGRADGSAQISDSGGSDPCGV